MSVRRSASPSRTPFLWIAIGVLAATIRLGRLDHFSYWLDEILDVYTIRYPWGRMWRALRDGVFNPPLDYALLKIAETLQPTDAGRRLIPVLWGTLCVVAFGRLIARRASPAIGCVSALILACAPYHVHYSQEVRPYSLGMLLLTVTLLLLDRYLEVPTTARLVLLYASAVLTAYTMYLAALILMIAGTALILEGALREDCSYRCSARRFLKWSPLFALAVAVAYLPWWGVFLRALKAPPLSTPPDFTWRRLARLATYFGGAPSDWYPLDAISLVFVFLVLGGSWLAWRNLRLRFLVVWAFGGLATVELLEHRHAVYDSIFHFIPAGMALTGLAAVPIGWMTKRGGAMLRLAGVLLLIVLVLNVRGLAGYFQNGRPDWRPLAAFLKPISSRERLFVESQYTQLCVGYYLVGPDWLCCPHADQREIVNRTCLPCYVGWARGRRALGMGSRRICESVLRGETLRSWQVRSRLMRTACVREPRAVRLPPEFFRLTTAGRIACSAGQLVAST